jgi:4-hydroxy-3-methylbut-2-enyl diphosphate reductase
MIVFIGHRNHDEAIGTMGEAPNHITVIESVEEVQKLSFPAGTKLAFVTQTTLSLFDAQKVIDALKKRFPGIRHPAKDDVCYATTNRQQAVTVLSPEADLVLVIGSKNSSNSLRLVETARSAGRPGYLIDDEGEVESGWFDGVETVLVTAGASAPEHLVDGLICRIKRDYGATVESRTLVEEEMTFDLPKSARSLAVVN